MRRCGCEAPGSPWELLALWSEANEGEAPVYEEAETARFRTSGIPFAHGATPFDPAPVPAGFETLVCEGEADRQRQERFLGISNGQALELWEALFDGCCAGKGETERAEAERFTEVFGWLAVLNRLETTDDPSTTLGEQAPRALQAIARIAQALAREP